MKRSILLFFFVMVLLPAWAADEYRTVTIQILKPAVQPVSFIDRSPAIYSVLYATEKASGNYAYRNDSTVAVQAALGMKEALEEFEALADYDIPVYTFLTFCEPDCDSLVKPITENDLLIVVKSVEILPFEQMEKRYSDYYGEYYYYLGVFAEYHATFELYDANTQQYMYREIFSDTLAWEKTTLDVAKSLKELPTKEEAKQLAAIEIGKLYAQKIVPHWLSVQRFFFVPSNRDLQRAATLAEASNWGEAMNIWEQYAGNKNRKIAAQSSFNMALACEISGNYELALEWLEYAGKIYPIKEITGYKSILNRRINERTTLEKQLQNL